MYVATLKERFFKLKSFPRPVFQGPLFLAQHRQCVTYSEIHRNPTKKNAGDSYRVIGSTETKRALHTTCGGDLGGDDVDHCGGNHDFAGDIYHDDNGEWCTSPFLSSGMSSSTLVKCST